jgi:hypothetical protein
MRIFLILPFLFWIGCSSGSSRGNLSSPEISIPPPGGEEPRKSRPPKGIPLRSTSQRESPSGTKSESTPKEIYIPLKDFGQVIEFQERRLALTKGGKDEPIERKRLFMLYLLAERYIEAEKLLKGLEASDLIYLNSAYLYNILGEYRIAQERLKSVLQRWEGFEGISIQRLKLCEFVEGFGRYKEYPHGNRFKPGSTLLLYVEPRNFRLKREGEKWVLSLGYNWELIDKDGNRIEITSWENAPRRDKFDHIEFLCRVKEFFQTFRLPLPKNLPMGRYKLRCTVKDLNTGKSAHASLEIQITEIY